MELPATRAATICALCKERMQRLHDQGRLIYTKSGMPRFKRYLDEMPGRPITTVWTDIPPINSQAQERLGYPTQKPEALLERIIRASSNEGDTVLDPFCGCGTTIAVAERLGRLWIGVDITYLAVNLMKRRLADTFRDELSRYEVIGDPKDLSSAAALAEENRYDFEWWAVDLVGAHPAQDKKKGADTGIDGYINFFEDERGKAKTIVVQVKSGGVNRGQIATLKGDMEREGAVIGVFITLEEPTRPMREEAAVAGFYESPWGKHPRLQILTVRELLDGKSIDYPPERHVSVTYRRAPRARGKKAEQIGMGLPVENSGQPGQ